MFSPQLSHEIYYELSHTEPSILHKSAHPQYDAFLPAKTKKGKVPALKEYRILLTNMSSIPALSYGLVEKTKMALMIISKCLSTQKLMKVM